jgi:uncharacterized protein YndB with AHSA1/START domain
MNRAPGDFLVFDCDTFIDAPVDKVFALVSDLGRSAEWAGSGHIRSITQETPGPARMGTRYRSSEKITMPYHAETEIIAFEPNRLVKWKSKPVGERVPFHRWSFELIPDGDGTRLFHRVRAARAGGYMWLVQGLGFLFTKPRKTIPPGMERTLANIKALAEV